MPHLLGYLTAEAHENRPGPADRHMLSRFPHRPVPPRIATGEMLHGRASGVIIDMANLLGEIVTGEIDAKPAAHQGQRTHRVHPAAVIGEL